MLFELNDSAVIGAQSMLVQHARTLEAQARKLNDKRVTRTWLASELAMAKASNAMAQESVKALREALRKPLAIADALGTGETGEALVGVARNAHTAELQVAAIHRACDEASSNETECAKVRAIIGYDS